jgi:opacity protein-like surface antigen
MRNLLLIAVLVIASAVAAAAAESGPTPRASRFGRTLVFPNAQVKYPLHGSYTRRWVDRPLPLDTSLRVRHSA